MILNTTMKHKGQYHFRIHRKKTDELCENRFTSLKDYLYSMRTQCPNEYFLDGPRTSVLKINLGTNLKNEHHSIQGFAQMGLDSEYYDNAHMNVQMFMLAYDANTIAIEIPIWLKPEEHKNFKELFNSNQPLSGHIDIISIENNKIWIWDYKPNAHREKHADTQTYFYALMLSKRTGIPLENFMCGYFDVKNTYVFDPSTVNL